MKKLVFGLILGLTLSLGVNVNAAEISGQLVKIIDSDRGGNVLTYNKDSVLNAKLGAEAGTADNVGGTLVLYNGGEKNKRIALGTSKQYDYGAISILDKTNTIKASIKADDPVYGPIIFLANSNGDASTYLTSDKGYINNDKIITENYLKHNYINKSDVQKMIDDAVQKALSK